MDERVRRVIEHMQQRIDCRLTVSALAAIADLSVAHLTRLFRAETGLTPAAFLHRLRMEHARFLVERTSLSVAEVRARVGITDRSHFARDFRLAHGLSPRMLRRLLPRKDALPYCSRCG